MEDGSQPLDLGSGIVWDSYSDKVKAFCVAFAPKRNDYVRIQITPKHHLQDKCKGFILSSVKIEPAALACFGCRRKTVHPIF
ncbi:unnamed protein product [Allacma fusca]|uniref:Uncharacterized protein n=1 Tax=Allacma fusca TaxID=39272 RepID=A0A8J2PNH7_9HEXA|nr:unnamed protein product [Allacma fusca]